MVFRQDRHSIFILQAIFILFNPINFFTNNLHEIIPFFTSIIFSSSLIYLLFRNEKTIDNQYFTLLFKAFKIVGLTYLFLLISSFSLVFMLVFLSDFFGLTNEEYVLDSFTNFPSFQVAAIMDHVIFLVLIPISVLIIMMLRKKYKPIQNNSVEVHLID